MSLNKRLYLHDSVSNSPSFRQLVIVNENSSNGKIRCIIATEESLILGNSQLYPRGVITVLVFNSIKQHK